MLGLPVSFLLLLIPQCLHYTVDVGSVDPTLGIWLPRNLIILGCSLFLRPPPHPPPLPPYTHTPLATPLPPAIAYCSKHKHWP